ncbi:MAG: fructose 1,6-bisphosphatase [Deltaproteobacteria bacterium]|nr:fructose 1,6-bisphosphatase [Deltaproteobacteria bacterium]
MAQVTVSLIKADVGSVGGHTRPHPLMLEAVKKVLRDGVEKNIVNDFYITRVGDDMQIITTHNKGINNSEVHGLAWNAFVEASNVAKKLKVYAAGQDLLKDAFSGNIRGLGPGAAEMTFEERKSEPLVFFMADKTAPSAYSVPLLNIFANPFKTTGLVIDPRMHDGFKFQIFDLIDHKEIMLSAPEELNDILAILGDTTRFAIKRVFSKNEELGIAASISTERLNLIAGKYVGKDDPVCIVRAQSGFPALGEILQPFMDPIFVPGWMRGSHNAVFYPVSIEESDPTYFDGPPPISAIGLHVTNGKLQGLEDPSSEIGEHIPVDYFKFPCWNHIREEAIKLNVAIRKQGPIMPAILPPEEMEYTTKPEVLEKLKDRFKKIAE